MDVASWTSALELDFHRKVIGGTTESLCNAIQRGADLRVYSEFLHNEHIDVTSDSDERIREVSEFRITYLLQDSWSAGIMSLRQPIQLPTGFGPRSSMSFFLYNQDGHQAIARPHLDGLTPEQSQQAPQIDDRLPMPKMHLHGMYDDDTISPSTNFIYDFDVYRFFVCDQWEEMLSHSADGTVLSGSVSSLADAFSTGCELKIGVRGLCDPLADGPAMMDHEVFVQAHSGYYYTEQKRFMVGSHPVIRVKPAVPMSYESKGWDFGWLMVRTDGHLVYRRCDPYTLAFQDIESRHAVRWFVRR